MKMNEIITEERTDEVIPAIAAGVARGAAAVGGAALRGGAALARGAAKVGGAAARGVAGAAKTGVQAAGQAAGQAAVSTVGKAMGGGAPGAEDKSPEAMRAKQEQKKAIQQSMADAKAQIAALQKELAAIR